MKEKPFVTGDSGSVVSHVPYDFGRYSCPVPRPGETVSRRSQCKTDQRTQTILALNPGRTRILVPTDFSPCSARAVEYAANLAGEHVVCVTLLHIINVNPPDSGRWAGAAETMMERLWTRGFDQMGRLAASPAGKQIVPGTIIEEGLPWEQIVEQSGNADLIVLGKNRSRRWNFFSQHTVERVMKDAKCPVVAVAGHNGGAERN